MSSDGQATYSHTRIMLRPVGSALPLGFFSFSVGMLLLACASIGWIPADESRQVGMLLMAFVFPLELVATVFAFLARDTLGATTLGLFTTSWLALGWLSESGPAGRSTATGVYLFGFAAAVFLLALMSTRAKPFFTVLLVLAAARMILDGAYEVGASHAFQTASGCVALPLVALALYGGAALGLEDAQQRELLPLFRRGTAQEAFSGYEAQLARLEREPGVRQQL
jgi:succinate-acetate transporter protein